MQNRKQLVITGVFIIALTLRFFLSLYNRQANDDHMEVINWILEKNALPVKEDCWECSQPKFYYLLNVGIIKIFDIENPVDRIIAAQMFNFVLSIGILFFAWGFIRNQTTSFRTRALAFSVVALNPCLIGINAQATNDTLEILAGCGVIYFTDQYFRTWKNKFMAGVMISMILACITKGSGLILLLGMIVVFLFQLILLSKEKRKKLVVHLTIFSIAFLSVVPLAGGYYASYKKYGSPFINNISHKDPPPHFFRQTYPLRPGITSIVHGYFTFRIFGMLEQPYITNSENDFPMHRTSLWSQLYGRTFFMHFDQYPGTWATLNPAVLRVGKALLLLALLPLSFFVLGCASAVRKLIRALIKRNYALATENFLWIHAAIVLSALLFIVKYTYDYRDFATMKSIFVLPVFLSMIALFISGFEKIRSRQYINIATALLAGLILLSAVDAAYLINQLHKLVV